ncbi:MULTISPECIES: hypothetical protein [unclassified Novosphingobium]|uniref:hypothetical protein n=1 Tax=unclassified Novosphingobium TaxID=2644732 RepID=UPI000EBCC393|nr:MULTISPECIES: hypothetical protein [unclassified Novosphingobium]HCF25519.1 hypothetical protein [Novosphingobium sp.]HQV04796.1 hypothetical protein [Novosphingobium sp.]
MRTFFQILLQTPRAIGFVLLMGIVFTATMLRTPGEDSAARKEASNPWGNNASSGSSTRAYSAKSSSSSSHDRRGDSFEASERAKDEAFRRQVIREMREEYEAQNGPVDTGNGY